MVPRPVIDVIFHVESVFGVKRGIRALLGGENQEFSFFSSVLIGFFQLFSLPMANMEVPGPLSYAKLPGEIEFAVKLTPSGPLMPPNGRFSAKKPDENEHFLGTDVHVLCSTGWDVAG